MPKSSHVVQQVLVVLATAGVIVFNWLAATGRVNGVTPEVISALHPTLVTPAGYAFMIWSLIYFGMTAFSIYQLLPSNAERFIPIRRIYILSCVLNCAWIYFWHGDQVAICLVIILALLGTLLWINIKVKNAETNTQFWLVKAPFGIYFGWVTLATMVNLMIVLKDLNTGMSVATETALGCVLILFAALLGVIVRVKLGNYLYPLAIAWAVTGIGVKQSGQTLIVVAAAIACIITLFAALSFVLSKSPAEAQRSRN